MGKPKMISDKNSDAVQVLAMGNSENIDGSAPASVQQTLAVDEENETVFRLVGVTNGSYIKFGANPAASSGGGSYLPEGAVEYFRIEKGHKIAVYGGIVNLSICK